MLLERHENFLLWPTRSKNIAAGKSMILGITLVWNQGTDIDYYVKTIRLYCQNTNSRNVCCNVSAIDEPENDCIRINSKLFYFNSDEDAASFASLMENTDYTTSTTKDSQGRRSMHIKFTPNPYTQTENHTSTSGCYAHPSYVDLSKYSPYNTMSVPLSLSSLYCYPISSFGNNMNQVAYIPSVTYANSTNTLQCKMPSSQMNYAMAAPHAASSGTYHSNGERIKEWTLAPYLGSTDKEQDEYDDYRTDWDRDEKKFRIWVKVWAPLFDFVHCIFQKDIQGMLIVSEYWVVVKFKHETFTGNQKQKENWKKIQEWSSKYAFYYNERNELVDTRPKDVQEESKRIILELFDRKDYRLYKDIPEIRH